MFKRNNLQGFVLILSLVFLIIFALIAQMWVQSNQATWQDIVLAHEHFDRENIKVSAINWAHGYVQASHRCFEAQDLNFLGVGGKSHTLAIACHAIGDEYTFRVKLTLKQ